MFQALRNDNEPNILAVKGELEVVLTKKHGIEIVPEDSVAYDSASDGLAELAVRECKAKARSLKAQVEAIHGIELDATHPILAWAVEFAAMSINIGRRGPDGRTAWELRHGRDWKGELACFSEKLVLKPI